MDPSSFRKKVILNLLGSPWTVVPAAGGLTLLLASWAVGSGVALLQVLGVTALLTSIGSLCTRWIFQSDRITREVFEAMQAEAERKAEQELDNLDHRLRQDRDPRPEACLAELRDLYDAFKKNTELPKNIGHEAALEITNKVEKLFKSCILSLERTHELWLTAREMKSRQARDSLCEDRERIVQEIQASTQQLARTLDVVHTLAANQGQDGQLAQIRQELNQSLEVARRVEQRMQSMEAELGGTVTQRERE